MGNIDIAVLTSGLISMTDKIQAHERADPLGADRKRCVIWGGSAGGALAVSVAYRLVSSGQKGKLAGLVAVEPMCLYPDACPTQYKHLHRSYIENGGPVPLVTWQDCVGAYTLLGSMPPYNDPSWFPISMGSDAMKHFPPTYIINTDKEVMRDDGKVLEHELKDAGVPVKRDVMMGLPHYFWIFPLEKAGASFRSKLVGGFQWILETRQEE